MPRSVRHQRAVLAVVAGTVVMVALLLGLVGWNLYQGVPLRQTLRAFADNSYQLYLRNDGPDQVTVEVGFHPGPAMLVPAGATVLVSEVSDESTTFPVQVTGSGSTTCFPVPFYQGAYPSKKVVVARSQTKAAYCIR